MGSSKSKKSVMEKIWKWLCEKAEHDPKLRYTMLKYWFRLYNVKRDFESALTICYINNIAYSIADIDQMRFLSDNIIAQRPKQLFKFFSNMLAVNEKGESIRDEYGNIRNFSIEALKNNTVFIKNPRKYNDPYDTHLAVDRDIFIKKRLRHYSIIKNVEFAEGEEINVLVNKFTNVIIEHIVNNSNNINSLTSLFNTDEKNNKREAISRLDFQINLIDYIKKNINDKEAEEILRVVFYAVYDALKKEYESQTKDNFTYKTACFTTRFDSILMWSHYANEHQGFCIEYDSSPSNETNKELRYSLFPVIYCDHISDLTNEMLMHESDKLPEELVFSVYKKGLLRKSTDWKYENEWRLVFSCLTSESDKPIDVFKIKKVYLGCKMPAKEKQKLIEICKDNDVEYSGMTLNGFKYKMEPCDTLCEKCHFHIEKLQQEGTLTKEEIN